jgi:hypothetical protein
LDNHNILSASIDKQNFKLNTRAFMIRFQEEEVELNDIGHFRIEIDTNQNADLSDEGFKGSLISKLGNAALHEGK